MIFYALHIESQKSKRVELLHAACKKIGIEFRTLDPYNFDFSKPSPVKGGDIVYRTNRGKALRFFEDYIVRPGVVTFYKNEIFHKPDPFMLDKQGIQVPKTIFCLSKNPQRLKAYVQELGGFPVILKALGGTRGLGVMKIDNFSSLLGIVDFLIGQGKLLVLKEFIHTKASARFIVLGEKVIASMEYVAPKEDFRTNAAKNLTVKSKKYSSEIENIAIKASQAYGWEFAGVDILIRGKKGYVSEVNFPCNFVRAQKVTKKDIALQMVQYLLEKSQN